MIVSYLQPRSNYVLSGLFKRGDGVNVYREESYSLALYYRCIRYYLVISCHLLNAFVLIFSTTSKRNQTFSENTLTMVAQ